MSKEDFFIGWSAQTPRVDRRFMLAASAGLIASAAGAGALMASAHDSAVGGRWDGVVRDWTGLLLSEPYPLLRTLDLDGTPRTAFLATSRKTAVRAPAHLDGAFVRVRAGLIARDNQAMLAVADGEAGIVADAAAAPASLLDWPAVAAGDVMLTGEILDAKCWFGAMRPGFGRTHKACAALCTRGGLPLAFCVGSVCSLGGEAPLLLDAGGRPHGRAILPLVADPVVLRGRLVQVGDVQQIRADLGAIHRL
ncbi:MAG: hypothetical protein AB7Q23_16825 [Hyphomonadaceae bacterium]